MTYLFLALFLVIGWVFGVFAFSQIIGSIRVRSHFFALFFWLFLTIALTATIYTFASQWFTGYLIGLAIAFVQILLTPNIE